MGDLREHSLESVPKIKDIEDLDYISLCLPHSQEADRREPPYATQVTAHGTKPFSNLNFPKNNVSRHENNSNAVENATEDAQ